MQIVLFHCKQFLRYNCDHHWLISDHVTLSRKGHNQVRVACVASVSVRFRSKERGTRVKDREKRGESKRAGRGWGRKEGNVSFLSAFPSAFPSFPSPSPLFHFLTLVSFLARSKPKVPFRGISLLRNQTETLATQAKVRVARSR